MKYARTMSRYRNQKIMNINGYHDVSDMGKLQCTYQKHVMEYYAQIVRMIDSLIFNELNVNYLLIC